MKLATDDEVIIGSSGETTKFKIATSAKAFKILSSGLYKNKIRAVVRELSCNCIDAHTLNGSKEKFKIQVPSTLDPRFIIRDFGPGLCADDITNLYSTYFASTKNDSNDFIGALGLGSKSPFSYTETFTVVSYHKGTVSGYTAMLDKGEPVIRQLYSEPMSAEDKEGIEITVPVKVNDIGRWKEEIAYVVRPFGAERVQVSGSVTPDYFPEFTDFLGLKTQNYGHPEREGLWAMYGNIVYPLSNVPGLSRNWLTYKYPLTYIRFELGELDITPSREELSFDDDTIKNIITRVNAISDKLLADDLKELNELSNEREILRRIEDLGYEANRLLARHTSTFGKNKLTINQLKTKFDPKDEKLADGVVYEITYDSKLKRFKNSSNSRQVTKGTLFSVSENKVYVVIDDVPNKRLDAVRALYHSCSIRKDTKVDKELEILKDRADGKLPKQYTNVVFYSEEVATEVVPKIKKLFEGDEVFVFRVSELLERFKEWVPPKAVREKSDRPKTASATKYTMTKTGWTTKAEFLSAADAEDIEGYVVFSNRNDYYSVDESIGQIFNAGVPVFCKMAASCGIKEFYIMRPTLHAKIRKIGNCECLVKEAIDHFVKLIDEVDYDEYPSVTHKTSSYTRHIDKHPKILGDMAKNFNRSGTVSEKSKELIDVSRYIRSVSIGGTNPIKEDLKLANRIFARLQEYANSLLSDKITKFEKQNIIACSYMSYNWDINEEQAKDLAKILQLGS